jgi:hypothetical protein
MYGRQSHTLAEMTTYDKLLHVEQLAKIEIKNGKKWEPPKQTAGGIKKIKITRNSLAEAELKYFGTATSLITQGNIFFSEIKIHLCRDH